MISVVVATRDRLGPLRALLAALERQETIRRWELVVVDNDPAGTARRVVAESPFDATYVVEPRPGAAHARNRAIAEARGDVVAMLDDDVVPDPGWLDAVTAPIEDGRAEVTGGPVHLDPTVPRPRWLDERVVGGYLTHHDLGDEERLLGDAEFVVTANAAFRADVLRRVGGFRLDLGPRPGRQLVGDDVDLVRRCQRAGARIRWIPGARVVHELPRERLEPRWVVRRAWLQGRSDWMVERDVLERRRGNGARVAVDWFVAEARRRRGEGLTRPDVAFHLACDAARTAGRLWEAARWSVSDR